MSDSFCSLLSATPNSTHAASKITTISSIVQPFCICTHCNHCNHLLTFNHHLSHVAEERGSDVQPQQSSRWSPTPVQLLVLEELYRKGMKTPSAEQIQQIASQLRQFGKIEGKNVFYWFQNHKARERQKRRRREMEETASSTTEGLKETGCGDKETKKWASTSNCSEHAEESQSGAALDIGAEKGSNISNGWAQIEERELQVLRKDMAERHAKCQNMEMPCFPPFITIPMPTTTSSVVANATCNTQVYQKRGFFNYYYNNNNEQENGHQHNPRTLELFPLNKDGQDDICLAAANVASMDTSEQFFEFLPLRN